MALSGQVAQGRRAKRHRMDGPATVRRDPETGISVVETWNVDGALHRIDGPAQIIRDETTGIADEEGWFVHGRRHRIDGPAQLSRNCETGEIIFQRHFEQGVEKSNDPQRSLSEPS